MALCETEKTEQNTPMNPREVENGECNRSISNVSIKHLSRAVFSKSVGFPHGLWSRENYRRAVAIAVGSMILNVIMMIFLIIALSARGLEVLPTALPSPSTLFDSCPDGWVGYQRRCYYFAESEANWTSSKISCASLNASLAVIDSPEEMNFLRRYKTRADHWIGLQRDLEIEPWKWINGTIFNNWFQIGGGGECAYINHKGIASSSCIREEPWICSRPAGR
ncbi:C-type lectin domain family 2 member B-like isoform X1 [Rhineura floridana]|uniref:C-type lectin domain family 2 member B-like isoform X1 n=1 Tax=Rhineura floridana TaxID=261503 RepID=UPI002AC8511B|nr:C-type lectin domain family 2 member B-like isoform X1 [Rhineura floridana]XP_061475200.1 C-type lectin domain family 2 member B-like isoform X1 [Rhineura floridana]